MEEKAVSASLSQGINLVPKPTRVPYMNYAQAFRNSYTGPACKITEMMRQAGQSWRQLSEADKEPFVRMAEEEKAKPRQVVPRRPKRRLRPKEKVDKPLKASRAVNNRKVARAGLKKPLKRLQPKIKRGKARGRGRKARTSYSSDSCGRSDCSVCY